MNQYTTPKSIVTKLIDHVDALNSDAIFMVKRIRASKKILNEKENYEQTKKNLLSLIEEIELNPSKHTLLLRTAKRRALYVLGYMIREFELRSKQLQKIEVASSSAKRSRPSSTTAALVARFIINEALRLNEKYKAPENEVYLKRNVSIVPESAMTDPHKLAALLTNNSDDSLSLNDLSETDPLEGMDSLT